MWLARASKAAKAQRSGATSMFSFWSFPYLRTLTSAAISTPGLTDAIAHFLQGTGRVAQRLLAACRSLASPLPFNSLSTQLAPSRRHCRGIAVSLDKLFCLPHVCLVHVLPPLPKIWESIIHSHHKTNSITYSNSTQRHITDSCVS